MVLLMFLIWLLTSIFYCSLLPPPVEWAQRRTTVFITICLEDCKKPEIKIESDKVYFKGSGGTDRKEHEVTLNLYAEIKPEVG